MMLTHYIESNIIELLHDIESSLSSPTSILVYLRQCRDKLVCSPNKDILILKQIGIAERKTQHPSHSRMFLSVGLIDDIHRMIDFRGKEDRILDHRRHGPSPEAIYDFLS